MIVGIVVAELSVAVVGGDVEVVADTGIAEGVLISFAEDVVVVGVRNWESTFSVVGEAVSRVGL